MFGLTSGNAFEIFVLALAASHVVTIALIVLWLGLGKPIGFRQFWDRFRREFFTLSPRR